MRNIIFAILVTLLTACGGAEFSADADALGGDAGAPDVTVGGSTITVTGGRAGSVSAGGSSSTGGKPAGAAGSAPAGGTAQAGSGGAGGTAPATCEFDPAKLTALLPKTIVWQDFMYTEGALCVTCRDKPCVTINVTAWGVPELFTETGEYRYVPNIARPVAPLSIGANDGACTPQNTDCGINVTVDNFKFIPVWVGDSWKLSMIQVQAGASGNVCLADSKFNNAYSLQSDIGQEFTATLGKLKIPCD